MLNIYALTDMFAKLYIHLNVYEVKAWQKFLIQSARSTGR